jgi:hypothetical protein
MLIMCYAKNPLILTFSPEYRGEGTSGVRVRQIGPTPTIPETIPDPQLASSNPAGILSAAVGSAVV